MNDFNAIAPIYDLLKHLVFWGRLEQAKRAFLDRISHHSRVLIIGGGSGQVLKYLDELGIDLLVDYIEQSKGMIRQARARELKNLKVNWFQQSALDFDTNQTYDIVIANFVFDLFEEESLNRLLILVRNWIKSDGQLLVADFQIKKAWHLWLSRLMHYFFRAVAGLESSGLQDLDAKIRRYGFEREESKAFYGRFVFSSIYRARG